VILAMPQPLQPPNPIGSESAIITQGQLRRERLRLTSFVFQRTPSGQTRAEVELEWLEGERIVGRAQGVTSELGDLRVSAEAALRALEGFSKGAARLELTGVKMMRAFDANIVIVSVLSTGADGTHRLLGCHLAEHDPVRSAVVAVLHATNRTLGNFIATR
jgi:hypothetical protein